MTNMCVSFLFFSFFSYTKKPEKPKKARTNPIKSPKARAFKKARTVQTLLMTKEFMHGWPDGKGGRLQSRIGQNSLHTVLFYKGQSDPYILLFNVVL